MITSPIIVFWYQLRQMSWSVMRLMI